MTERDDAITVLERELMLLGRHNLGPGRADSLGELDRSAYLLLARLRGGPPLSLRELAESLRLDVSTVNRQVGALLRRGLAERVPDPDGGVARKLRPTRAGTRQLDADRDAYRRGLALVFDDWPADEQAAFARSLRRMNEKIEALQGIGWPREEQRAESLRES